MTTSFTLASKTKVDSFMDSASINDIVNYSIDCKPWQEDNSTITSATWTVDGGSSSAAISSQSLVDGVVSALVNFTQAGLSNLRIQLITATQKKTIWLQVKVNDMTVDGYSGDDYGYGT